MENFRDQSSPAFTRIAIVGTRGAIGTSTLTAVLSLARATHPQVLVDANEYSAGLDFTVGAHRESGLRWGDLTEISPDVDPHHLAQALPQWQAGPILSADHHGAHQPGPQLSYLTTALAAGGYGVSVDLGCVTRAEALAGVDAVVILAGRDERSVRRAVALREQIEAVNLPWLLGVGGPGGKAVARCEVAEVLGATQYVTVPQIRGLAAYQERGFGLFPGRGGRLLRAGEEIAKWARTLDGFTVRAGALHPGPVRRNQREAS